MGNIPTNGVWELTYACNMHCKHCGSSCGEKYPNELTTGEALHLCDDLADMGMNLITLSGGEPFMREDWPEIAKRFTRRGVKTNVISNGWFITPELIKKAQKSGIINIGISLDGLKETHDFIRKKGAYDRVMVAMDNAKELNMPIAINTSINRKNLYELKELEDVLVEKGVCKWQFQIASPMGNLLDNPDLIITPGEMDVLIDAVYEIMKRGKIIPYLADDIGYYAKKEMEIRGSCAENKGPLCAWGGCFAGKRVIGIRANGDISGCLSIRDDNFIEGNIREVPLKELWTRPGGFAWNREFTKEKLTGFCKTCQYAARCLGGCSGAKLTLSSSLYENRYCSYRNKTENELRNIQNNSDVESLLIRAREFITSGEYQCAHGALLKVLSLDQENKTAMDLFSYTLYLLGSYADSIEYTKKILKLNSRNSYAYKVQGISYAKMGQVNKGIRALQKAIKYVTKNEYGDIYINLAAILDDNNMTKEALKILKQARKYSEPFKAQSEPMYQALQKKLEQQKAKTDVGNRDFVRVDQIKSSSK